MGSTKFTLTRERRNEISQYIDNEFIKELLKETVNYIKTVDKAEIDDSLFDDGDENSRVSLISRGSFNVYDYMYFKDFLTENSWEGSYVQEEAEEDSIEGLHEYRTVYRYEPYDIGTVIYKKVQENMEQKKASIYKEFKNRYTDEEYLFKSARFYKRTRDGKEYYDIDLAELNSDKKRSLEERIKTELGNAFKSRWGSSITSKVCGLEDEFMLDIYERGCSLLKIPNDYFTECVTEGHSIGEEKLIEIMTDSCRNVHSQIEGITQLKIKVMNTIDKRIDSLLSMKIYKTDDYMNLFLEDAGKLVFSFYKSMTIGRGRHHLKNREDRILKIIRRMAVVYNILYTDYLSENEKAPSIEEMQEFKECIPWMCLKGPVWTAENIYIKKMAKDELAQVILDDPIDEYEEARYMERHFYLHVGETNTGKTYSSIQRLMEVQTGVYLAPLRLLALEIQDKLNSENVPCSLLTGEEEDIIPYAGHVASTIEKLETGKTYDVCVIVMVILEVYSFINNIYKYIRRNKRSI